MNWSNVKSSAVPSLKTLSKLGAGSLAHASNFIKIEIFRDFWQIISLFFEGLEDSLPDSYRDVIGNFSVSFSFCFSCWWNDPSVQRDIGITFFVIQSMVALLCCVLFYCQSADPNAAIQGLEAVTWASRGKGSKKRLKYLLLILTTLYLPVFRDIVLSLTCDLKYYPSQGDCSSGVYAGLAFLCVVNLVVYIIPFPFILYRIVQRNKPIPSHFDAEGNERVGGYTDSDYRADLEKDTCPYKVLYDGYERKWGFYKPVVLVIKILLVLPVVLFVNTNQVGDRDALSRDKSLLLVQSIWTIVVLVIYSAVSTSTQPFIKDSDDQIDMVSRYSALLIAVLGCVASQISGAEVAFGILLNVVTVLSGIVITFYMLSGFKAVQRMFQKLTKKVAFTMTRDTDQPLVFSNQLKLTKERKFRVWHEFWDTLFAQDEKFRIPEAESKKDKNSEAEEEEEEQQEAKADKDDDDYEPKDLAFQYGGSPPWLLNFEQTVGERHAENKEIIKFESFKSFKQSLSVAVNADGDREQSLLSAMRYVMHALHGVDVYWEGKCVNLNDCADSTVTDAEEVDNTSALKFGKCYIIAFPFCAVFISDDDDHANALFSICPVIAGKKFDVEQGMANLIEFATINQSEEIQRRKEVRGKLRALTGSKCHWPIQKYKDKQVSKQVSYTDNEGNQKTKTEHKSIRVLFSFNDGVFTAVTKNDANWEGIDVSRGFAPQLHYNDGAGSHDEHDWSPSSWNNEPITIFGDDFGLNAQYEQTDAFTNFMNQNYSNDAHEPRKAEIAANLQKYSDFYAKQFVQKEQVLSYAFWYFVYNNDSISREELKAVLGMEQDAALKHLVDDAQYIEGVNMVYDKLAFVNTSPKHLFWFTFWHDVWVNNLLMPVFIENEDFLSPYKHTSLCYTLIEDKQALIDQLKEKKLYGPVNAITKGWINHVIVDLLYAKLEDVSNGADQDVNVEVELDGVTVALNDNMNIEEQYAMACKYIQQIADKSE